MSVLKSDLASVFKSNRIRYFPSCVIVCMLTEFYSQVSAANPDALTGSAFPNLMALLRRLAANLASAAETYAGSETRFFPGDWREDRLRARTIYFNLVSRLGHLVGLMEAAEGSLLRRVVNDMHRAWSALEEAMEGKGASRRIHPEQTCCRYFRSLHPSCWQMVMARIVLALEADTAEERPGTVLLLLCYSRVKAHILKELARLERKNTIRGDRFSPDRILCLSDEDQGLSCPNCMTLTEGLRNGNPAAEGRGAPICCTRDTAHYARRVDTANRRRSDATVSLARRRRLGE